MREITYRTHIVAQESRRKARAPTDAGVQVLRGHAVTMAAVELLHMSTKRPLGVAEENEGRTASELCDVLAASSPG